MRNRKRWNRRECGTKEWRRKRNGGGTRSAEEAEHGVRRRRNTDCGTKRGGHGELFYKEGEDRL